MTEEEKRKHKAELNRARVKRYRENHAGEQTQIAVRLSTKKYALWLNKLNECGMTQKQFIEQAIDRFLKGE